LQYIDVPGDSMNSIYRLMQLIFSTLLKPKKSSNFVLANIQGWKSDRSSGLKYLRKSKIIKTI